MKFYITLISLVFSLQLVAQINFQNLNVNSPNNENIVISQTQYPGSFLYKASLEFVESSNWTFSPSVEMRLNIINKVTNIPVDFDWISFKIKSNQVSLDNDQLSGKVIDQINLSILNDYINNISCYSAPSISYTGQDGWIQVSFYFKNPQNCFQNLNLSANYNIAGSSAIIAVVNDAFYPNPDPAGNSSFESYMINNTLEAEFDCMALDIEVADIQFRKSDGGYYSASSGSLFISDQYLCDEFVNQNRSEYQQSSEIVGISSNKFFISSNIEFSSFKIFSYSGQVIEIGKIEHNQFNIIQNLNGPYVVLLYGEDSIQSTKMFFFN